MKRFLVNARGGQPTIRFQSPMASSRQYISSEGASRQGAPTRKQVTVVSDDGRVQWQDLSRREKVARTTQQTFNFGLVLSGFILTVCVLTNSINAFTKPRQGGVIYFLYSEVFAADSKTRHFNRAVDRVRGDVRALELLGSGQKIRAFGEPTSNKWARARPIAYRSQCTTICVRRSLMSETQVNTPQRQARI